MQGRSYRGLSNQVGVNVMENNLVNQVAKNLRFLRTRTFKETKNKNNELVFRHIRQEQLAKEVLNVTFQQIQKYETGLNKIDAIKLYKLAKYFEVPMEIFFDEKLSEKINYTKVIRNNAPQLQHNI